MAGTKAKGGKKGRKYGKNLRSPSMKRYRAEGRCFKNKKRRVFKHYKNNDTDLVARNWITRNA
jgi:hypothetical protein